MSKFKTYSGTYIYDKKSGELIKISDRIPTLTKIPDWKRGMNPEEETKRSYESLEAQGKLNDVNDKDIWSKYANR